MKLFDAHTHRLDAGPDALINIEPDHTGPLPPEGLLSTGIHPWRSAEAPVLWPLVEQLARRPRIAAIGECGLDRLRGAPIPVQQELLMRHALLARELHKPLIIHCVRAWAELLSVHAAVRPTVPWTVHGFRGGPDLARQLLHAGLNISLGPRFNPRTAAIIPPDRLAIETDTSAIPLADIARAVQQARNTTPNQILT